jgi:dihydroorotate dehydrogenase electron transfer subunit
MKQLKAIIISNEKVLGEFWKEGQLKTLYSRLIWMQCPDIASEAKVGQFIMVNCGEECVLPRPFSIHQANTNGTIALLFAVLNKGRGTGWLSQRIAGENIGIFGPLGNGFSIKPASHNLLLVAGGMGIASIYFLAQKALENKNSIKLIYGTADNQRYPIPPELNLISSTEDGSVGHKGMATDLLPEFTQWADQIFACGPAAMYKSMARMPELKGKDVQLSLEIMMGCGVGVCYGCTIKTKSGLKQVCKDGPVFEMGEVDWERKPSDISHGTF